MGAKKNLIGQKFGRLTVLEETDERNSQGSVVWKCKCDCGNIHYVSTSSLTRKEKAISSCGCYKDEVASNNTVKDITGKRFGLLTAISRAPKPEGVDRGGAWWYCDCDCGTKNVLCSRDILQSGNTKSCGCLQSASELKIRKILNLNNIKYKTQYTFDDCINPDTGWKLKFDFAILDDQDNLKFLIEYDGEQHFYGMRYVKDKNLRDEKNKKILMFDTIKTKYCEEHSIKLYRINFMQRNDLENVVLSILKKEGIMYSGYTTDMQEGGKQIWENFKQDKLKKEN